jgi:hypothetical protein
MHNEKYHYDLLVLVTIINYSCSYLKNLRNGILAEKNCTTIRNDSDIRY